MLLEEKNIKQEDKNQNALWNLLVEPLKVIISSAGEEYDSKVHCS